MAIKENTSIELPALKIGLMEVTLIGDSPLIVHAWSLKAKREMLGKQRKEAKAAKEAKDPKADFEASMYRLAGGGYGFPSVAFKSAAVTAATSVAAESHRLAQARGLIRAVVAIYVDDEKAAVRMKAFVHVPENGAPHYRETRHAMSQTHTRDLVLMQAWRELQYWRRRYRDLSEFAKVFEATDEVARKLPAPKRRVA